MGYEGHAALMTERAQREAAVAEAMRLLREAHADVGGEVVSAGATGTFACNDAATEIQAGSYALMDTAYAELDLPFQQALYLVARVISVSADYAVADCGLKALGMDHGNPRIDGARVWFCSDEHVTFAPEAPVAVGDAIRVWPAHVDPTVAYHDRLYIADGESVIDSWPVDLRGW
jgi:D-serine deaminase-like pyridoxal phosphate-dependent protein